MRCRHSKTNPNIRPSTGMQTYFQVVLLTMASISTHSSSGGGKSKQPNHHNVQSINSQRLLTRQGAVSGSFSRSNYYSLPLSLLSRTLSIADLHHERYVLSSCLSVAGPQLLLSSGSRATHIKLTKALNVISKPAVPSLQHTHII